MLYWAGGYMQEDTLMTVSVITRMENQFLTDSLCILLCIHKGKHNIWIIMCEMLEADHLFSKLLAYYYNLQYEKC